MVLGSWSPKTTICPFRARKWPCQAPKTLRFKGKMANFEATNAVKQGKKTAKGQMVPISRVFLKGVGVRAEVSDFLHKPFGSVLSDHSTFLRDLIESLHLLADLLQHLLEEEASWASIYGSLFGASSGAT